MDISKASNFERFIWDVGGRRTATRSPWLWKQVDEEGGFDLSTDRRVGEASRRTRASFPGAAPTRTASTTIRLVKKKYGAVIDPHTADGVKIALRMREPRYPMICLETALPAKFDETIVEALGVHAPRPAAFEGIERLAQRFDRRCNPIPRPSSAS